VISGFLEKLGMDAHARRVDTRPFFLTRNGLGTRLSQYQLIDSTNLKNRTAGMTDQAGSGTATDTAMSYVSEYARTRYRLSLSILSNLFRRRKFQLNLLHHKLLITEQGQYHCAMSGRPQQYPWQTSHHHAPAFMKPLFTNPIVLLISKYHDDCVTNQHEPSWSQVCEQKYVCRICLTHNRINFNGRIITCLEV
jgi:hypothetical protein